MKKKGVILFGGSFDPIHLGHLSMAQFAVDYLCADKLIFIPAARSPHKTNSTFASGKDRFEMISLAIRDKEKFSVSEVELNRPEPSYTFDTVTYFCNQYKDVPIYWLTGADNVAELGRWYRIQELLNICTVCVMYRAGVQKPSFKALRTMLSEEQINGLIANVIPTPLVNISSSEIRETIKKNKYVIDMIPQEVYEYIYIKGLYDVGSQERFS